MLGAIIGDIVGSRFEFHNLKSRNFSLFSPQCHVTDDSVMTLAVAKSLLEYLRNPEEALGEQAQFWLRKIGIHYPNCGYGSRFFTWIFTDTPLPYNSYGNGAAMRVSPCGFAADSLEDAIQMAREVTEITHNHPEGMKGAEAVAAAIYIALHGGSINQIRSYINDRYYTLDFTLDRIRDSYTFDASCQGSVPQAITAFLESNGFEDAIRNAISIGGDSDTIASITGALAEAYYGVPDYIREQTLPYLDRAQLEILREFESLFPPRLSWTPAEA